MAAGPMPQGAPPAPSPAMPALPGAAPGGVGAPKPPVTIDAVMELLRDDRMRGFRIEVDTDQLVEADEAAEKKSRIEFMMTLGQLAAGAAQLMQTPVGKFVMPAVGEGLLFTVRGFKVGRELEERFESAIDNMIQALSAPPEPPPPDPAAQIKMKAAEVQLSVAQIKAQAEDRKAQMEIQGKQVEQQDDFARMQLDMQKNQSDAAREERMAQLEEKMMLLEHELKLREHHLNAQASARDHAMNAQAADRQHAMDMQAAAVAPQPDPFGGF